MSQPICHIYKALYFALLVICLSSCSFLGFGKDVRSFMYTVESGDTIFKLSQRYGVSTEEIIEINDLDDPNRLSVGQILRIPARVDRSFPANNATKADQKSLKTVSLVRAKKYIGTFSYPVSGAKITSPFGNRWKNFHEGIDFSAPEGTTIRAAHEGTVVYSDNRISGYGNMIIIQNDALISVYAHNDENVVSRGDRVQQGEKIGTVGKTGHATGAHVHFETRVRDAKGNYVAVDPIIFLAKSQS